jgi:hypothetical protein
MAARRANPFVRFLVALLLVALVAAISFAIGYFIGTRLAGTIVPLP